MSFASFRTFACPDPSGAVEKETAGDAKDKKNTTQV